MSDLNLVVRLEVRRLALRDELQAVISTIPGVVLRGADTPEGVDVLIMELGDAPAAEIARIEALRDSAQAREVFVTSARLDPELIIQAMRAGAREFLRQPVPAEELRHALIRSLTAKIEESARRGRRTFGRIVYALGGKGGVGTTTLAVNLAAALRRRTPEGKVALMDMNLFLGEVPLFLNLHPAFNWGEVARNISRLDSAFLTGVLSRHESGLMVLPSPTGLDGGGAATPEIIERILLVMKSDFDWVVIDGGHSVDRFSLKILELADVVLLVGILSLPCLINLRTLLETFTGLGHPPESRLRIVMNRYQKKGEVITLRQAEEGLGRPVWWLVPNDYPTTMSAINTGRLVAEVAPRAEIAASFEKLAGDLAGIGESGGGVRR